MELTKSSANIERRIVEAARPDPFEFAIDRSALIVIDMQNDFCTEGGLASAAGAKIAHTKAIIPTVKRMLEWARDIGITVVHTREGFLPDLSDCPEVKLERKRLYGGIGIGEEGPLGRFLIRGSASHAIVDELLPLDGEPVIDKAGHDAFYETHLSDELVARGITDLFFVGVTTECCVSSTVRSARDRGYRNLIVSDAVASLEPEFHLASLSVFEYLFGWIAASEDVVVSSRIR